MVYKNKHTKRTIINYYKNREKRIIYQKKWDSENKEKKREYDKKRYYNKRGNFLRGVRKFSNKYYKEKLIKKYSNCQLCDSNEKLEIHHKKYTKKIEDCLLLCQKCHKKIHRIHNKKIFNP